MITVLPSEFIPVIRKIESAVINNGLDEITPENYQLIQKTLTEYLNTNDKITHAPTEYLQNLNVITLDNQDIPTWHVDFDLWINNLQSDLTLSMELSKVNQNINSQILNLHVM